MEGCHAGYPFPIPKTGQEAIWNHLVRYSGRAYESRFQNYNVNGGHATLASAATNLQDFPYWDATRKDADVFVRLKNVRSEEHTSELQSLMRISYAVFCLK